MRSRETSCLNAGLGIDSEEMATRHLPTIPDEDFEAIDYQDAMP